MIHILYGNDSKKKSAYLASHFKKLESVRFSNSNISPEILLNYASSASLFGDSPVVILENILKSENLSINDKLLKTLAESDNTFIFLEDKLLVSDEKKYKKYATLEKFEEKLAKSAPKINIFSIANAFEKKDKINTWIEYLRAIEAGTEPEAISGILFWKIKSMLLSESQNFSRESLLHQSSSIISLYHKAHNGEVDLSIGLEQFILSALTK